MNDLIHIMLGAALVSVGVLSAALADRIRGIRFTRERPSRDRDREQHDREQRQNADNVRQLRSSKRSLQSVPTVPTTSAHLAMARDVTAALIKSGYSKTEAAKAVAGCGGNECSTLESWIRAALKQCTQQQAAAS
jgi:hypothetical protein